MVNHHQEHGYDAHEPGGSWIGLLAGLLIGLLIGGLTGAMAMLLLAPQSGKKTRAKIHRQSAKWREQATDSVEDAVAQARDTAHQVTHDLGKH